MCEFVVGGLIYLNNREDIADLGFTEDLNLL